MAILIKEYLGHNPIFDVNNRQTTQDAVNAAKKSMPKKSTKVTKKPKKC